MTQKSTLLTGESLSESARVTFIAELAFEGGNLVEEAKVGILAASLFAGLAGYAVLRLVLQR